MFFLKKIYFKIIDIVFPHECGICSKKIDTFNYKHNEFICTMCLGGKRLIAPLVIDYYKKKIVVFSLFHASDIKKLVHSKYIKKSGFYSWAGIQIGKLIEKKNIDCDIISFVPQHHIRTSVRWFNHAEIIAKSSSRYLNKQCMQIIKTKKLKKTQSQLNKQERVKNISDSFEVIQEENIYNKHIIIVDDIYTTGATIKEVIKTVYPYKPLSITVFVIAR
jgi:competence protein ComFC